MIWRPIVVFLFLAIVHFRLLDEAGVDLLGLFELEAGVVAVEADAAAACGTRADSGSLSVSFMSAMAE